MRAARCTPLALSLASIVVASTVLVGCIDPPEGYPRYPIYPPAGAPPGGAPPGYPGYPAYPSGFLPGQPAPGAAYAVAFATSRVGAPYCWGGTGPGCYDCSGLTRSAWLAGGKTIPRTSSAQAAGLPEVPLPWAQPGDILWKPGHVALYVGGGWVVSAPGRGQVVKYTSTAGYVRALRP